MNQLKDQKQTKKQTIKFTTQQQKITNKKLLFKQNKAYK